MLDVVIIGSGPAGLTSAIYAKRAELSVVVIEKEYLGTGQIAESSLVDNYPGIPETDGYSLGEAFREHAERLGTEFIEAEVTSIEKKDNIFICKCDNGDTIEAESVIFATGCHHRNLGIEDEAKYTGKGISYCAVCDGAFYKDKTATVIGGGDTALDDALYLSDICSRVNLIHRRDEFRGSKLTLERLKSKENVNIITKANVKNITGEKKIESIVLDTGEIVNTDGLFVAVGMVPQTELLKDFDVLDNNGYVKAQEDCRTSCDGLYVAGDIRTKKLRQVITAAADGANAVQSIISLR
jgi:thioredoxin reductase (NADPH)